MNTITCSNVYIQVEDFQKNFLHESSLKIFGINIPEYSSIIHWLYDLLDENEKIHASKFHFKKDSNRFIICRALLKIVLAHEANIDITDIKFEREANGKPYLKSLDAFSFNIAHTDTYALIAIDKYPVGIDIEFLNYDFDYYEILPHSFGSHECNAISKANDSTQTFFKFWTRKEAIVKMTGKGIDGNLNRLQVIDGINALDSILLNKNEDVHVVSFTLDNNNIASIAKSSTIDVSSQLLVLDLPYSINSLDQLIKEYE